MLNTIAAKRVYVRRLVVIICLTLCLVRLELLEYKVGKKTSQCDRTNDK